MITEIQKQIMEFSILDADEWVSNPFVKDFMIPNRINACLEDMKKHWLPILQERNIAIPEDNTEFAELVFSQPDYKSRAEREAELLPSLEEQLEEAKQEKYTQIKNLRKENINKPTPQTITYSGGLANKMFKVNFDKDITAINGVISDLEHSIANLVLNPKRGWTDINGDRWELNIDDFKSLRKHILDRDDQERKQEELKNKAIQAIVPTAQKTIEQAIAEVKAFDITQIIT